MFALHENALYADGKIFTSLQDNVETSVEIVDAQTTRIANKRNGRISQIIINVLSEDHNTINNEYIRMDEDGNIIRVSHAVYKRIQ